MVRTALPTATLDDTGWTLVGGASVDACIAEGVDTADDATSYVQSTVPGDSFTVQVSDIGLPPPFYAAGHKIRVRARDVGIAVVHGTFRVELWTGGGAIFTSATITTDLGHAWTTHEIDVDSGVPLTDYSDVAIVLYDNDGGSGQRIRISAVELVAPSEIPIDPNGAGGSAASATAKGIGALPAGTSGSSAARAAIVATGRPSGSTAGGSSASAQPTGIHAAVGAATGACAAAITIGAIGVLICTTVGGSSTAAACKGTGAISGSVSGVTQAAALPRATGRVGGSTAGSSAANFSEEGVVEVGPFEEIARALRSRFNGAVAQPSSLPTHYDNAPFVVPGTSSYVRLRTHCEASEQIAIGPGLTNRYRMRGEVVASVVTPLGLGDAEALNIVDDIAAGFRGATFFPMVMRAPDVSAGYRDGDAWAIDVRVPFQADYDIERIAGSAPISLTRALAAGVIRSRFATLIETPESVTTQYDGEPQDPTPIDELWVRFTVVHGSQAAGEHVGGSLRYRTVGIAYATIRAPIEQGERDALRLGDTIADAFRSVSDQGVTFRTPLVRAKQREGPWWRVDVTCPFHWDEIA